MILLIMEDIIIVELIKYYRLLMLCFFYKSGIAAGVSHSLLETMAAGRGIIAWNNHIHNQICDQKMLS